MKKIVLFGGSFDPIHNGHLHIAQMALEQCCADQVWFVVSAQNPFKEKQTDFLHRFRMVEKAIAEKPRFKAIDIENRRPSPSYSIETVHQLIEGHPGSEFFWLIGSDHLERLDEWKDIDTLRDLVQFVVYPRTNENLKTDLKVLGGQVRVVSSTEIRKGNSVDTKPSVLNYMTENNLYTKIMLEERLSKKRFDHVLRVTDLALDIATAHSLNLKEVETACLWHDMFKEDEDLSSLLKGYDPRLLDLHPAFYHAWAARITLSQRYYYRNKSVLSAIANHVDGRASNQIAMVLFIADKCEPGRGYDASDLIELAKKDLVKGFRATKNASNAYRREHGNT